MSPREIKDLKVILVGEVSEYKSSAQQALVDLNHEHGLCVGDTIRVRGTPEWDQLVERMSQNGKPVAKTFPGESVWIHFGHPAKKGDNVFLLVWVILSDPPEPPTEPTEPPNLPDPDNFPSCKGGKGKGHGAGG